MLDKRNIAALEDWGKVPFESEQAMVEALTDSEYHSKQNPVFRIAVQAKLRLRDSWSIGTTGHRKEISQPVEHYGTQPKG